MGDADFDAATAAATHWMQAWMDQDRATLDAFLAPDFELIVSTVPTKPFRRSDWLETAVTAYVCTRFVYEDAHCRPISDDLVAISAIADFDATIGGIDRSGR
jgi:ketosteroid isomerase-like protein